MSSHEFLPPYSDPSFELGSVPMPCLKDQLEELETRFNKDEDSSSDYPVIDLMTTAGVKVDEAAGEMALSCWRSDCMARCIVAISLDKPFSVRDSQQLQQCAKNTTGNSNE
jgi:hypothetical protein